MKFNDLKNDFLDYQANVEEKLMGSSPNEAPQQSKQDCIEKIKKRLLEVEGRVDKCEIQVEEGQQRSRLVNLEFHGIPYEWYKDFPEDTYAIIINFCRIHLDIYIDLRDISICHRQVIPSEKKKLGKRYIAPIYCKFVNRSLANTIFERRHLLNNVYNIYNTKFEIKENLTYHRRMLLESVESELGHLKSWTKNGKIYVKESAEQKPIRITDDDTIKDLARKHPKTESATSHLSNIKASHVEKPATQNIFNYNRHYANAVSNEQNIYRQDRYHQPLHLSNFPPMPGYVSNGNSLGNLHPFYRPFTPKSRVLQRFKSKSFIDYRSTV